MIPPRSSNYTSKRTRRIRRNLLRLGLMLLLCTSMVCAGFFLFLYWSKGHEEALPPPVTTTAPTPPPTEETDPTEDPAQETSSGEDPDGEDEDDGDTDPQDPDPDASDIDPEGHIPWDDLVVSYDELPPILAETMAIVEDPFFSDVFFIGDSITTGLDRHAQFDNHLLADIGLTLERANNRVWDYKHLRPSRIFILLGANDLGYFYMTEELFAEQYRQLITTLRELYPEAGIFPQSILPVAWYYSGIDALNNPNITSYNQALQDLCQELGIVYIDIGAPWRLPDDSLHPEVSSGDGLHIKFAYYGTWLLRLKEMSSKE